MTNGGCSIQAQRLHFFINGGWNSVGIVIVWNGQKIHSIMGVSDWTETYYAAGQQPISTQWVVEDREEFEPGIIQHKRWDNLLQMWQSTESSTHYKSSMSLNTLVTVFLYGVFMYFLYCMVRVFPGTLVSSDSPKTGSVLTLHLKMSIGMYECVGLQNCVAKCPCSSSNGSSTVPNLPRQWV